MTPPTSSEPRVPVTASARSARPRWVAWAGAILLAGVTARLGVWQLSRAHEKEGLQAQQLQRAAEPPLAAAALARDARDAAAQFDRRIDIEGHWLPDATLYLDNRVMAGRTGFVVVTPLRLSDGSAVLVQRGWVARHQTDRTRLIAVPTPSAPVRFSARVTHWPSRTYEFGPEVPGVIRQNVDRDVQASAWRVALRPVSLQQLAQQPDPADPLLRDWPLPAVDVHRHYGYAVQWFGLSALVVGLALWFGLYRPRRRNAD